MFTFRPFDFSPADYTAMVAVWNAAYPHELTGVGYSMRQDESARARPEWAFVRLLAELDDAEPGRCVAYGQFRHKPWAYHPHKLACYIVVHPAFEGTGVDDALYDLLRQQMQPYEPITLESGVFESHAYGVRFLEQRGFEPVQRSQSSELDAAAFDPQEYAGLLERVAGEGIRIRTLREMLAEDPEFLRRLHQLESAVVTDVPYYDEQITPVEYDDWIKGYFEADNPDLLPEGQMMALDGDRLVGMSALWATEATDRLLYTGFTGVLREYRHRGIATALKVHALSYAKQRLTSEGRPPLVRTSNDATNPMLQINLRLGFRPIPAWITYVKEFGDGG